MIKVAPSILAADFAALGEAVERIDRCGADFIHCDVMDGMFVPNISFGPGMIRALRGHTKKVLDVHLMVEKPERYIDDFIAAGADMITVHFEASPHPHRTLSYIRSRGVKAGIVYNPATPPDSLEYLLEQTDMVLLMTVNPGFGGQCFLPEVLPKIERVRRMIGGREVLLEVDGGITIENATLVKKAGADVLVAGSSIFSSENPRAVMEELKK